MSLTAAQALSLKNDINANTNSITYPDPITGTPITVQIKNTAANDGTAANAIATWYNLPCAVNFFGNYATVPLAKVKGAIAWKKLTPVDAIPASPQLDVVLWTARSNACQGMQFNLQMLLTPVSAPGVPATIDATQAKVVTGFQDALSAVPSAAGGAAQDAGWASVQTILNRKASNIEKLLADLSGGNGAANTTPATFTFEGTIEGTDVFAARNS